MKKRFWALFLAVMMVVSVLPTSAFAEEVSDPFDPLQPAARYFQFDGTEIEDAENADITLSKTAEYKGKGKYEITLTADAKQIVMPKATEVVFVLDASSSMNACTDADCTHDKSTGDRCDTTNNYGGGWGSNNAVEAFKHPESRWVIATKAIADMKTALGDEGISYKYVAFGSNAAVYTSYENVDHSGINYTNLTKGVELGLKQFSDGDTNKALIIVSDGASSDGYEPDGLDEFEGDVYAVGFTFSSKDFQDMADDGKYYTAADALELKIAMKEIAKNIIGLITDPMGDSVDLLDTTVEVATDDKPDAVVTGSTINWTDSKGLNGEVTLTYEVEIKPAKQKAGSLELPLNGAAKLNYSIGDVVESIEFPIPKAVIKAATLDVDYMLNGKKIDNDHEWINLTEDETFKTTVPEVEAEIEIKGETYWVSAVNGEVPSDPDAEAYEVTVTLTDEEPIVEYTITYYDNVADETIEVPAPHTKQHDYPGFISKDIPVREGYEFLSWNTEPDGSGDKYVAQDEYTENADLDLYAQWAINTYTVTYDWGTPAEAVTEEYDLPVDENKYASGAKYEVDDTEYAVIYVQDAYGNNNGKYTFSGWTDPNHGEMGNADVTITGEWEYEEITVETHNVIYDWGTPADAVTEEYDLPVDENEYVPGEDYEVDDTEYAVIYVQDAYGNNNGKYTFSGWTDPNHGEMGNSDVTITGEWEYEEITVTTYAVTYNWGTENIPTGVTLPVDSTAYVNNQPYEINDEYTSATVVYSYDAYGIANGKYTFSGWDKEDGVIAAANVEVKGSWSYAPYQPADLKIFKEIASIGGKEVEYNEDGTVKTMAKVGDQIVWNIKVQNTGESATTVTVKDILKVGSEIIETAVWPNITIVIQPGVEEGDGVTLAGAMKYIVKESDQGKSIVNTAVATDDNGKEKESDPTPGIIVEKPAVSITKTADKTAVKVGDKVTYTIVVENKGNVELTGVKVTDTFVAGGKGKLTVKSGDLEIGTLAVGETATIVLEYVTVADDVKGLENSAVVKTNETEDAASTAKVTVTKKNEPVRPVGPSKPALNKADHYAYVVGYPDGLVHPEKNITRAEVSTIFFRMLLDESREDFWAQENWFSDVPADQWYNNAVSTLANAGLISGYPDGSFKPNANITRAEFATIAIRFFLEEDVEITENNLSDVKGHWAEANINLAYALNLINGYPDGTFRPDQKITRAEAMTIVNRVLERTPDKDHLLEDMIEWPDNMDKDMWYYADVQEATNSHEFYKTKDQDTEEVYEIWTELLPVRDWVALEQMWSQSNSSKNPGEVVDINITTP